MIYDSIDKYLLGDSIPYGRYCCNFFTSTEDLHEFYRHHSGGPFVSNYSIDPGRLDNIWDKQPIQYPTIYNQDSYRMIQLYGFSASYSGVFHMNFPFMVHEHTHSRFADISEADQSFTNKQVIFNVLMNTGTTITSSGIGSTMRITSKNSGSLPLKSFDHGMDSFILKTILNKTTMVNIFDDAGILHKLEPSEDVFKNDIIENLGKIADDIGHYPVKSKKNILDVFRTENCKCLSLIWSPKKVKSGKFESYTLC